MAREILVAVRDRIRRHAVQQRHALTPPLLRASPARAAPRRCRDMPVDMTTGLPVRPQRSISRRKVMSPLAILKASTPTRSSRSTADSESGVASTASPCARARATICAMRLFVELECGEEVHHRARVDVRGRRRVRRHQARGDQGLQLDRRRSRRGRGIDQLQRAGHRPAVVEADLGDRRTAASRGSPSGRRLRFLENHAASDLQPAVSRSAAAGTSNSDQTMVSGRCGTGVRPPSAAVTR